MRLFFFFQAEDGIRDIGVTGVQTCALPICGDIVSPEGDVMLDDPKTVEAVAQWANLITEDKISPIGLAGADADKDRKSTRLNSRHAHISYAVFCLKKKNTYDPIWPPVAAPP